MPKVLISGYYGFNNIGDEAILKGMIDGIKSLRKDVEIVVLSQHPEFTAKKHNVRSIKRMNLWAIIRELGNCDLLVSGGGSLFQDVTSKRSILYYLGIIYLAKLMAKKVMIYSQGIGPVNINYNRYFLKKIFNKVDCINVRDESSKKELLDMGINKEILVTVDTVFSIKKPDKKIGKQILKDLNLENKKIVGISIRPWHNSKNIISEMTLFCQALVKKYDYEILFIPCHFYSDLKIMKDVLKNIEESAASKVHLLENYLYVPEYLSLIGNVEFLIGMRLHALIFSILMEVPVIGVSYDPKIDNFMKRLGKNNTLSVSNINFNDIMDEVENLTKNMEKEKENIAQKREGLLKMANRHNEELINML